jgi:hypothetical protein
MLNEKLSDMTPITTTAVITTTTTTTTQYKFHHKWLNDLSDSHNRGDGKGVVTVGEPLKLAVTVIIRKVR